MRIYNHFAIWKPAFRQSEIACFGYWMFLTLGVCVCVFVCMRARARYAHAYVLLQQ